MRSIEFGEITGNYIVQPTDQDVLYPQALCGVRVYVHETSLNPANTPSTGHSLAMKFVAEIQLRPEYLFI